MIVYQPARSPHCFHFVAARFRASHHLFRLRLAALCGKSQRQAGQPRVFTRGLSSVKRAASTVDSLGEYRWFVEQSLRVFLYSEVNTLAALNVLFFLNSMFSLLLRSVPAATVPKL
jgi:hypothetical protein